MTYKIKYGDTLTSIARNYNTTVDALVQANGIKNKNLIYAGDTLSIPDGNVSYSNYSPAATSGNTQTLRGGGVVISTKKSETDKAADDISKWRNSRPASYADKYSSKIDDLLRQMSERKFSYNPDQDPLQIQYRNKYLNDADLAMKDALGIAASKTGGHQNSYAIAAANQAYGNTVSGYADILPKLYEAAYNRYNNESEDLATRLKLLMSLSDSDWDKYNDNIDNYLNEGKILMKNYDDLSKEDIESYLDYLALMKK